MLLRVFLILLSISLLCFLFSCGDDDDDSRGSDDDDDSQDDDHAGDDDDDDDDDDSCPKVIWDYITIDSYPAPANPVTGRESPPKYNKAKYFRFRGDTGHESPDEVEAILIMVPGYTVGVGYMSYMAKSLVELSCGRVEVWTAERRHHLLEDSTGMDAAEAAKDPDIAYSYYWEGGAIDGKTFDGFLNPYNSETGFLSEWGLDLSMWDIRKIIEQVPEESRQKTVYLSGHSRGVVYAKAYAAYEFDDGHKGRDDLAGLLMIDGESRFLPIFTKGIYETTINSLRKGLLPRYMTLPPFGPPIYTNFEILAMAASEDFTNPDDPRLGPDGVYGKFGPMAFLVPIMYRFKDVTLSNEAFLGWATDKESGLVGLLLAGFGKLDGPTATDFLGAYPTDANHIYKWKHYDQVDPIEFCEVQDFIKSLYEGPSNGMDPYYATRLDIDFYAAGIFETGGTWKSDYFLLDNGAMDVPVFALGSRLLSEKSDRLYFYRDQLPPVRGQNLPRDQFGFDILWRDDWEHLDTAFAIAQTNEFFHLAVDWMLEFSHGTVAIPIE